jgi:hypothetical protein
MSQAHIKMKLVLIAPFNALVLAILALRGYSATRVALQTALFFCWSGLFAYQITPTRIRRGLPFLLLNLLLFGLCLANTGGLVSPFMPLVLSMVAGVSVSLSSLGERGAFFGAVTVLFVSSRPPRTPKRAGSWLPLPPTTGFRPPSTSSSRSPL